MPQSRSAKKRLRQNVKRRVRNRSVRSATRTQMRKVRDRLAAQDLAGAENELRLAAKQLDQAAAKGVIHKNMAARLKSRLSQQLNRFRTTAGAAS